MSIAQSNEHATRHSGRLSSALRVVMVLAFAAVMFWAGRLWSLREVREARRAAGRAEDERIELQRQLTEARNKLLLQETDDASPHD